MHPRPLRLLLLLASALLLGGCSSIETDAARGTGLAKTQRFFVVSNLNDNHALDQRIVTALQARGLTAAAGPRTMMPDDTQGVVVYQDHWSWDFGEHLAYLRLAMHKPESNEVLAAATFSARIPSKDAPAVVAQLVARLFDHKNSAPGPASHPPAPDLRAESKRRAR